MQSSTMMAMAMAMAMASMMMISSSLLLIVLQNHNNVADAFQPLLVVRRITTTCCSSQKKRSPSTRQQQQQLHPNNHPPFRSLGPRRYAQPIDQAAERSEPSSSSSSSSSQSDILNDDQGYRETLLRLAKWSLEDYEWRSSVFKSNQADRMVEETLARMQGKEPSYLRPMDASEEKIGPLGAWEKSAVEWLSNVIDEEGRRAKQIIALQGQLIRPIEADQLGPLGLLEKRVVEFWRLIGSSEKERVRTQTLRPMDLEESIRGPLGKWEERVSRFFRELRESEALRLQQSQSRGGEMVRPIDVPGPLGELELWIGEILKAEEMRAMELNEKRQEKQQQQEQQNDKDSSSSTSNNDVIGGGGPTLLRPKDAKVKGPLGEVEQRAFDFLDDLSAEEMERLRNMQQYLKEARPMESNRYSVLGVLEALVVGLLRSPLLIVSVVDRVRELMRSESMLINNDNDKHQQDQQQRMEEEEKQPPPPPQEPNSKKEEQ